MRRNIIPALSALLALALAFFVYKQSQSVTTTTQIPVLKVDVVEGTRLTPDIVGLMEVDERVVKDLPVVTDAASQLYGKVAFTRLFANVPILHNQIIDSSLKLFEESQSNYFVSFGLDEVGIQRLPYNFVKGKVNICLAYFSPEVLGQFKMGLPVDQLETAEASKVVCPAKYVTAMALTADNMLPTTSIVYDPVAQKYTIGPEAAKIGFWMGTEEDMARLTDLLFRSQAIGRGKVKTFLMIPPQNEETLNAPMEFPPIDWVDLYDKFDLEWEPEDPRTP